MTKNIKIIDIMPEGAELIKQWPIITSINKNKNNKHEHWTIVVYRLGGDVFKDAYWCQDGSKVQRAPVAVLKGKNLGKTNETTPEEQATLEAEAQWIAKRDKLQPQVILPMLAQKFTERKKHIVYPCSGQPKFDGFRLLMNSAKTPRAWSRSGKEYDFVIKGTNTLAIEHLLFDTQGYTLDGEIMLPQQFPFQLLKSAVSGNPELVSHLEYHVYDVVEENTSWIDRLEILKQLVPSFPESVHIVETFPVVSEEDAEKCERVMVEEGHEGLMLRNLKGLYTTDARSNDLQKLKTFEDAEFKITQVIDGKGKEEGAAIFICETETGKLFEVRPQGTYEVRNGWFNEPESFVGKQLTVKFFGRSIDGTPRFPVGLCTRDYENGKVVY